MLINKLLIWHLVISHFCHFTLKRYRAQYYALNIWEVVPFCLMAPMFWATHLCARYMCAFFKDSDLALNCRQVEERSSSLSLE